MEDEAQRVLDELKQKEMEKERLDEENKKDLSRARTFGEEKETRLNHSSQI